VADFIAGHERVFVIEQNRDAQLRTLLITEAGADPAKLVSIRRYGGLPLATGEVVGDILEHLAEPELPLSREATA
jgi:2-oxoglutarate ferredoxin oxidoreductase subunit alpha